MVTEELQKLIDRREKPLLSRVLHLQSQLIRDHRDEFAVGGLAAAALDGVAEVGVEHLHVASVPRDLDRVTDGALHPRRRRVILFRDGGVELLGHGVDDLRLLDGKDDGVAQIMVALDMGGDSYLVQDLRHLQLEAAAVKTDLPDAAFGFLPLTLRQPHDVFRQIAEIERL